MLFTAWKQEETDTWTKKLIYNDFRRYLYCSNNFKDLNALSFFFTLTLVKEPKLLPEWAKMHHERCKQGHL